MFTEGEFAKVVGHNVHETKHHMPKGTVCRVIRSSMDDLYAEDPEYPDTRWSLTFGDHLFEPRKEDDSFKVTKRDHDLIEMIEDGLGASMRQRDWQRIATLARLGVSTHE